MHRASPHQGLKRSLNLLVVLGMVLAALGIGLSTAPAVEAAPGDIVAIHQGGRARHSFVSEYPATGRLYTLWTDISNVAAFQLNLSASAAADGSGWNGPDAVGNDQVEKADFPQIKASSDGRLHAVWSDGSLDGRVVHAFFTPGPGKNVDDAGQWQVEVVSERGKNAYFDLDDAGNAYFIWNEQQGDGTPGLVVRRWDAASAQLGGSSLIRGNARLGSIAATGRGDSARLHTIFIDVADGNTPYYRELNAGFAAGTTVKLGDGRAGDPSPQIVEDGADNVHMVWVMSSRPQWEVFYRSRAASGAFGARETVSHNYSPTGTSANPNHASPTIAIDGTGTPYVAWKGSETGVSQIYERRREAGGFPDYSHDDAINQFCVSCGNGGSERGGLAEWPKYGFSTGGAVHLTWSQWDKSNTERVQYSLRRAAGGPRACGFTDVFTDTQYANAICALAARGIIRGFPDGSFQPSAPTLRAQMAALIARAQGWEDEEHGNFFPDQGPVDGNLWRNVNTLAFYRVALGYPDGTYKPTLNVAQAQTISFISRSMVAQGIWQLQPEDRSIYPNVPEGSGHRRDLVTYVRYVGPVPGTSSATQVWDEWAEEGSRAFFAQALLQAMPR